MISAILLVTSRELERKCRKEYLNTRFPLSTLLWGMQLPCIVIRDAPNIRFLFGIYICHLFHYHRAVFGQYRYRPNYSVMVPNTFNYYYKLNESHLLCLSPSHSHLSQRSGAKLDTHIHPQRTMISLIITITRRNITPHFF